MIKHKKAFGIYHWDTFEEGEDATILIGEASTLKEAQEFVAKKYAGRISGNGADQVDIVDKRGNIVQKYKVQ